MSNNNNNFIALGVFDDPSVQNVLSFYVNDQEGNRVEFTTKSGLKSSDRIVDDNGYTTN